MNFQDVLGILLAIVMGIHVKTILGLILLDVVLGIAHAIKEKRFDWRLVAEFYSSMVLPYLLAFAAFAGVAKLVSVDLLGPWGYLLGDGMVSLAWLTIIAHLAESIMAHLKGLAIPTPEGDGDYPGYD